MPQINQLLEVYAGQFFWLLLVIGILYFFIARGMVPKISQTVENRQKRISDDLAAAQLAQDRAEQVEEEYRKGLNEAQDSAQATIQSAKADVAKKNEASIKRADTTIAKAAEKADLELKESKAAAMAEIEAVATGAARDIVATISGAKVTAAAAKKAVKAAL